jgi:hypothetical protein
VAKTYKQPILKEDAQGNVIQESYVGDMKFRGEYSGGNIIYKGYARPGTATSTAAWQIAKLTYSGSSITQIDWPQNGSIASSEFIFVWDDRATYTYS